MHLIIITTMIVYIIITNMQKKWSFASSIPLYEKFTPIHSFQSFYLNDLYYLDHN
uniref:Uncharacterized protein n=1 Tax=Arundo donax TaxID=35708 RepID=A0A0A8ZG10_ARUDO